MDRYENKVRMKEVGGAGMQYKFFLKQSAILTLAKAIEDCFIDYEREIGTTLKFWKVAGTFPHGDYAKEVRALANIMKHNQSVIIGSSSTDAKYLVMQRGYPDNILLDLLMLQDARAFDIPTTLENIYCFLMEVVEKGTGYRHAFLNLEKSELTKALRDHLVPSVLEL